MAEVIKKVIQIDAGNSPKTVKELKNQISQLRDSLVTLDSTSDEYAAVVQQLTQAQQTLTTVMNAGKASVTAADGSYNALVQTMKTLQAEWKATADEARRAELGEQIAEINEQLKELDGTIGNSQRKVGSYKDEIVAAFDEIQDASKKTAVLAGSTAKSYSGAAGRMQTATEQMKAKFTSVQKIAAGMASAYAAVQGATALLGVENSNLEKTFVKLQAAIALAQGIGGLDKLFEGLVEAKEAFGDAFTAAKTFIKGLHGIKAAIVSTGIGALVVGIGLLIANWDKFGKMFSNNPVSNQIKQDTENLSKLRKYVDEETKTLSLRQNIKKAEGQTEIEALKEQIELNEHLRDTIGNQADDYYTNYINAIKKERKWFSGVSEEDVEEAKKNYDDLNALYQEMFDKYRLLQNQLTVTEITETNKRIEAARQELEEKYRIAEEERNTINSIIERLKNPLQLRKEQYDREKELLKDNLSALKDLETEYRKDIREIIQTNDDESYIEIEKYYNQIENLIDKNISKLKNKNANILGDYDESNESVKNVDNNADGWIEENELDSYKAYLDGRLDLLQANTEAENELIQSKIDLLKDQLAVQELLGQDTSNTTAQIESLNEQILDNNDKLAEATEDNNKKKEKSDEQYAQSKKKRDKLVADFSLNTASSTLKNLSSIAGEESKAGKAMAIASATIDTYQAANAAYKSMAGIPVVGPALGAAAAAAAVIAGIANVKQILKTDPENGDGNIASTASATPNLSLDSMMPMQYTRNLQTDTELDELNQSTKVYVTEEDITTTQNKVAMSEQNASF